MAHILLVDDERNVHDLVSRVLESKTDHKLGVLFRSCSQRSFATAAAFELTHLAHIQVRSRD